MESAGVVSKSVPPPHYAEIHVSSLNWDKCCSRVVRPVFATQGNSTRKGKLKSSLFFFTSVNTYMCL